MNVYWFRQPSQDPYTTGLFCSMLICPNLSIIHLLSESNINLAIWAKITVLFTPQNYDGSRDWRLSQTNAWFSGNNASASHCVFFSSVGSVCVVKLKLTNMRPPEQLSHITLWGERKNKKIRLVSETSFKENFGLILRWRSLYCIVSMVHHVDGSNHGYS